MSVAAKCDLVFPILLPPEERLRVSRRNLIGLILAEAGALCKEVLAALPWLEMSLILPLFVLVIY